MVTVTTYVIDIVSRSGRPINRVTGSPTESVGVYSKSELHRRLAELRTDPDLTVTWRQIDPKVVAQGLAAARRQGLIP